MSVDGKFRRFSREDYGDFALKRLKKKYKDENVDNVISLLRRLVDSGIYGCLFNVYINWDEPVPLLSDETTEIALENPLLVLAYDNLRHAPKPFSELIDYNNFYYFYPFLEWVYSMNLERQLTLEDVQKIFKSSIGERIIFNLEYFDEIKIAPEPTTEFFQKLKKLKWKDKKTKKLYSKIEKNIKILCFQELWI